MVPPFRDTLYVTVSATTTTFLSFVPKLWATTAVVDEPVTDLCHAYARGLQLTVSGVQQGGATR